MREIHVRGFLWALTHLEELWLTVCARPAYQVNCLSSPATHPKPGLGIQWSPRGRLQIARPQTTAKNKLLMYVLLRLSQ